MPHDNPYKTWAALPLTAAQREFMDRAHALVGGEKTDFVRNIMLDKAEELLGELAPDRDRTRRPAGSKAALREFGEMVLKDPDRAREFLTGIVRDVVADQKSTKS